MGILRFGPIACLAALLAAGTAVAQAVERGGRSIPAVAAQLKPGESVIEPNGVHVYYSRKQGSTARLDRDNTTGYGPENICVGPNASQPGAYEVFVVPYSGSVYPTTATITVTGRRSAARMSHIARALPRARHR